MELIVCLIIPRLQSPFPGDWLLNPVADYSSCLINPLSRITVWITQCDQSIDRRNTIIYYYNKKHIDLKWYLLVLNQSLVRCFSQMKSSLLQCRIQKSLKDCSRIYWHISQCERPCSAGDEMGSLWTLDSSEGGRKRKDPLCVFTEHFQCVYTIFVTVCTALWTCPLHTAFLLCSVWAQYYTKYTVH
jgi:hypothetical protein